MGIPRRKYYCKDCGYYHVTHLALYDFDSHNGLWEEDFYMDAFATRGMSSGVISLDFLNKTGIPFLLEEYNRWGKNK